MHQAVEDGIPFYLSENRVLLTPGIEGILPRRYFQRLSYINRIGDTFELIDIPFDAQVDVAPRVIGIDIPAADPNGLSSSSSSKRQHSKRSSDESKHPNPRQTQTPKQIDYFCVIDFEATCEDSNNQRSSNFNIAEQEIIEFPAVLIDRQGKVIDEFHSYVRPVRHPQLTEFCTQLTGIEQHTVDPAPTFPIVYCKFLAWCEKNRLIELSPELRQQLEDITGETLFNRSSSESSSNLVRCCVVTCGDWDFKTCFPKQMSLVNPLPRPDFLNRWCNIKQIFQNWKNNSGARGMPGMLEALGLELLGRHHSGIDDSRNIARITASLISKGTKVVVTTSASAESSGKRDKKR